MQTCNRNYDERGREGERGSVLYRRSKDVWHAARNRGRGRVKGVCVTMIQQGGERERGETETIGTGGKRRERG